MNHAVSSYENFAQQHVFYPNLSSVVDFPVNTMFPVHVLKPREKSKTWPYSLDVCFSCTYMQWVEVCYHAAVQSAWLDWVTQALTKHVSMLLSFLERLCHLGTEPFATHIISWLKCRGSYKVQQHQKNVVPLTPFYKSWLYKGVCAGSWESDCGDCWISKRETAFFMGTKPAKVWALHKEILLLAW